MAQPGASSQRVGWGDWLLSRSFTNHLTAFIISVPAFLTPFCPNTWKNCGRHNLANEHRIRVIVMLRLNRCVVLQIRASGPLAHGVVDRVNAWVPVQKIFLWAMS